MTEPSTDRSNVRKLRHSVRKRTYKALMLTGGQPGLSKDQQVAVVKQQIALLEEALAKAKTLLQVVETRDFDAYKAKKDALASMPDVEKVVASEEAAMADLTFAEIVAALEAKAPGQPMGENETHDENDQPLPPF